MVQTYKLYIDGRWTPASTGATFDSLNPSNKKVIARFHKANEEDTDKAIAAAKKAFPAWRDVPAPQRAKILWNVVELLKKNKARLGKLVATEMGKIMPEALGDVQEAIDVFEYMAGEGRRLFGHTTPSELRNKFAMTIRRPIGVVGLITPWNFPIAIPSWKIAPALICGNTIVFKPSSDTPMCAMELVNILVQAGVPAGVLNVVTGPGSTVGGRMIKHRDVRAISFTGSRSTGEWITQNAGVKKIGLELGGKNPIIIMDDADLELALDGVMFGAFGTTGQRCTACSRVIIHAPVQKKFEKMLLSRLRRTRLGDPTNAKTDVGPLINERAVHKAQKYVEIGKKEGAKMLCGGDCGTGSLSRGYFFKPTIFTDVKPRMIIAQEEIFAPVLAIIPVKSFEDALDVANDIAYGLSTAIYTADMYKAFRAVEVLEAGLTYINSSTIGSEVHLPFGGVKGTGNGTREAGIEGINEFSETKTVYIDFSGKLQKAQIDEFKID